VHQEVQKGKLNTIKSNYYLHSKEDGFDFGDKEYYPSPPKMGSYVVERTKVYEVKGNKLRYKENKPRGKENVDIS
jgi:hypothetical protein